MHPDSSPSSAPEILLRAVGLTKHYRQGGWFSTASHKVQALRGVDIHIRAGMTLGLIGASGSGKSTLARCLASIDQPDSGEIWFEGKNLVQGDRELLPCKRQIQMVFQEPAASLNPRLSALEVVSEPLLIAGEDKVRQRQRARELMQLVGVSPSSERRKPFEFSAGQRRRLAIARALALRPKLLILDESLAGLDLSIQAQISNLLLELQIAYSLTYICISHDLELVAHLADEIAVMHEGKIVDFAGTADFLAKPRSREAGCLQEASVQLNKFRAGSR